MTFYNEANDTKPQHPSATINDSLPEAKRVKRERAASSIPDNDDASTRLNGGQDSRNNAQLAEGISEAPRCNSDEGADFTIISDDNLAIKVKSYYLLAHR